VAPGVDDNANLGPNEVTKQVIAETSESADNKYDQATPGDNLIKSTVSASNFLLYLL